MNPSDSPRLTIDLNQFKLFLKMEDGRELKLHFDTPSRRFYLSVIAFVLEQMKENGRRKTVALADHAKTLALINETVGGKAGSSKKRRLLPRIYKKWKSSLPDLESAPLFKVIGSKKRYNEVSYKTYPFDDKTKDAWANLFEYAGSRENVRLRFSVEKLGIGLENVAVVYGHPSEQIEGKAWVRYLESLRQGAEARDHGDGDKEVKDVEGSKTGANAVQVSSEEMEEGRSDTPWEDSSDQIGRHAQEGQDASVEMLERVGPVSHKDRLQVISYPLAKQQQQANRKTQPKRQWFVYGSVLAVILVLAIWLGIREKRAIQQKAIKQTAYDTALPKIRKLLEEENYVAAYALAKETEKIIPQEPTLLRYLNDATNTMDITSTPLGAKVSYRPYNDLDGPWIDLGTTPIQGAQAPVAMHRFRIEKEGYEERNLVKPVLARDALPKEFLDAVGPLFCESYHFNLYEKDHVPEGMLPVDRSGSVVPIKGIPVNQSSTVINRFFVDETEVTNRAYKEFVDAGGYSDPTYWKQEFKKEGQVIPWAEAIKAFVDRTGRPGPSTWELGDYPEGQEDYPVAGVSWYEADAYARFRGKRLPTIYHWARAVFPVREISTPLTPHIVLQSNIEGEGVAKAGSYPGIGSSGVKDMAGNVREWCWNGFGEQRYSLGGTWQEPAYMFNEFARPSTWDRSPGNGFRCVIYPDDAPVPEKLFKDINLGIYDPYSIPAYSKKTFDAIKSMFRYKKTPLLPAVASRKPGGKGWIRETVSIDAAYNNERLTIHLDLPAACKPPYKAVIYFPSGNAFYQPEFSRVFLIEPWDAIPKNGRALITPIYSCTYERLEGKRDLHLKAPGQAFSEWVKDLGRTIDYLETRKDIDTHNLAYIGVSAGALLGPMFAPYEERIRSLILVSGALRYEVTGPKPKGLVQPHTIIPLLMLNGKYDYTWPVKTHQKPLFDLIGTPLEHKKHVIYNCGHLPLPRAPMLKEIFDWLDKYQGTVDCNGGSTAENASEKEGS